MTKTGWQNWSGSVHATPSRIAEPRNEAELAQIVTGTDRVRVTGAGHSFMPLCETDGTLIRLDRMEGELDIAADGATAWAPAGWSLARLTERLWEAGYSFLNQGDVNPQSLAGAISTGTHGTGAALGSLSTIARGFRLMLADGSTITCDADENGEIFEAQRLSLGLLGIALAIRIEIVPAYHLVEDIRAVRLAELTEQWDDLADEYRHVEFWVFPYSDMAILKTLEPCDPCDPPEKQSDMAEKAFASYCKTVRRVPKLAASLQRQIMKGVKPAERRGPAYRIFPSERNVRFEEIEHQLPRANGFAALAEVIDWIRTNKLPVSFPFEFRLVAGDDIWMSPFNAGPCASISMHQYAEMPWREIFADAEPIFREHGGRPHWAKRHTLRFDDLSALYPKTEDFRAVCREVDPQGKFANAHLAALFRLGE
ncbi:FAD-binding protein [Parasphingopyxis algicola]|uniref:D-arabinono-1,4-lactone oxidase n=1 Tax=Parasphingopyxis algicola TaxID=2026624 RepID=UPI0015A3BEFD|nr:D-arabinono-1,4-lactone oxidase [Parasphingopyxis algicola]QLC24692.1 FAD-binding protein [Parasphingopyxis algicola]